MIVRKMVLKTIAIETVAGTEANIEIGRVTIASGAMSIANATTITAATRNLSMRNRPFTIPRSNHRALASFSHSTLVASILSH